MADDIFTDEEIKALETAETDASDQVVETQEQPRDEHGRFAPKPTEEAEEAPAEPKQQDTVPQGALHAERERRKGVEAELKKAQEQLQALAALREQVKARQPATVETPQIEDDGLKHLTERLNQVEQSTHQVNQTLDMQRIEAAENEQIAAIVAQSDAEYRLEKPDYDDAINHVVQARGRELALYGYGPLEVRNIIGNEMVEVAKAAIAQGRRPAELGYQIAVERGYRPAESPAGQGQRQVEAISNARSQSRSLGQAAGATPKQLTADAIIAMSPEEFENLYMTREGRALIDSIAAGNA